MTRTVSSPRRFLILILALLGMLVPAMPARGEVGVITLNPTARIAPGDPALLRDVAALEGEPARALAATVVHTSAAAGFTVSVADVRAALTKQDANWGRLALRGSTCEVRVGDRAVRRVADETPAETAPAVVDLAGVQTVLTRLARLVARMFGVDNENLRLRFDERDEALLSRPVTERTRVEIQPASTASSSRMAFIVWIYEGEDPEPVSQNVRVDVLLRRPVVSATRELRPGEAIAEGDLVEAQQWIAPDGSVPIAGARQALGMRAKRKIAAGSTIRADQLEPPIACERGDLVKVHCVSGGIVVKAWARALGKALEGEHVELRMTGSEKTFRARMTGRGVAVMDLAG
ncbi:MAG: flagellar basal body P-ring formation protein FlgA [Phycisphaeraceae bacterium]|nr:flagellar basal body P-ring formation protein FlgA [Phycisphaeraceae bacterium]MCB9847976.1 flagellar basal body P-ring formation protein FlgA [Phycisphaeraceae bacterium]